MQAYKGHPLSARCDRLKRLVQDVIDELAKGPPVPESNTEHLQRLDLVEALLRGRDALNAAAITARQRYTAVTLEDPEEVAMQRLFHHATNQGVRA